jgi:hypothetical protein
MNKKALLVTTATCNKFGNVDLMNEKVLSTFEKH